MSTKISGATTTAFVGTLLIPVAAPGSTAALNITATSVVNAVLAAITPALIASLNYSQLPTTDPGNGGIWLNGGGGGVGVLQVGS